MSLDITLYEQNEVDSLNITHNLGEMAGHIPVCVLNDLTLYDVMWRADEHNIECAEHIIEYLEEARSYMIINRIELEKYNPPNGWGNFDGLLRVVDEYQRMCKENPDCYISLCR